MQKSSAVHQQILTLSREKTVYIKTGDMDGLSKLLIKERKLVQELTQIEAEREEIVERTFKDFQIDEAEKTVTVLLEHIEDKQEKSSLEQTVTELLENIIELRQSESLNKELIEQSMQFVQVSLDMLQPSERKINYQKDDQQEDHLPTRSVFDSKA